MREEKRVLPRLVFCELLPPLIDDWQSYHTHLHTHLHTCLMLCKYLFMLPILYWLILLFNMQPLLILIFWPCKCMPLILSEAAFHVVREIVFCHHHLQNIIMYREITTNQPITLSSLLVPESEYITTYTIQHSFLLEWILLTMIIKPSHYTHIPSNDDVADCWRKSIPCGCGSRFNPNN